ncbi:snurportin-1 isoform X2 [Hetaerina americana]
MDEKMEVGQSPSQSKRRGGICKMLMFSEWMTEIPEDLQNNWYFVPSPVGRRCVLKAHKGVTKIFSKWGKFLKRFQSALPSGCRGEYKHGPTILDCIWSEPKSICYVLDVIFWKGQSFIDCEAEFRFYWLKTKFEETPELQVITTQNQSVLQVLPSCLYSPSDLAGEVGINSAWATNSTSLDGILFYHQKGHYYSGEVTPLVEWLKPFMLPEVLGVEVPDVYLQERPDNYVSIEQYIAEEALKKKQYHRRKNQMEVDEDAAVMEEDMKDGCSIQEEMESVSGVDTPNKSYDQ